MGYPTNLTYGVATVPQQQPLGMYPLPDPFHTSSDSGLDVYTYSNDYTDLGNVASRVITGASSTFALTDGIGGFGLLTPGGTTTATTCYRYAASFQFVAGQKFWYLNRIKASAVSGNQIVQFGLIKSSGGTSSTTDSLLFVKAAGSTSLNLVSTVNGTATTLVTGVTTMADNTFVDVGFYYNGTDLLVYSSDALVARVPAVTIGASGTNLTNALMTTLFGITPVATETMTIDYEFAAMETTR
jgi:hypothetical protein